MKSLLVVVTWSLLCAVHVESRALGVRVKRQQEDDHDAFWQPLTLLLTCAVSFNATMVIMLSLYLIFSRKAVVKPKGEPKISPLEPHVMVPAGSATVIRLDPPARPAGDAKTSSSSQSPETQSSQSPRSNGTGKKLKSRSPKNKKAKRGDTNSPDSKSDGSGSPEAKPMLGAQGQVLAPSKNRGRKSKTPPKSKAKPSSPLGDQAAPPNKSRGRKSKSMTPPKLKAKPNSPPEGQAAASNKSRDRKSKSRTPPKLKLTQPTPPPPTRQKSLDLRSEYSEDAEPPPTPQLAGTDASAPKKQSQKMLMATRTRKGSRTTHVSYSLTKMIYTCIIIHHLCLSAWDRKER